MSLNASARADRSLHRSAAGAWAAPRAPALMALMALAVLISGCASNKAPAPVESRVAAPPAAASAPAAAAAPAVEPPPVADNAGKPGYYTVKRGDSLIRIALDNGQNWRDIARWNKLDNPNLIEVGQVLRVVPPAADAAAVAVQPVAAAGKVEARPLEARPATPVAPASAALPPAQAPAASSGSPVATAPAPPRAPVPPLTRDADEEIAWTWPASGAVIVSFDEQRSKGLAIAGKAGDPVYAAADGRVVYAGSGLRGYGNLLIVKHSNTFLTAYAHNQALLVKEDQAVRRGQKIAEMGSSDAEKVQLHFEIRRQGKPVDPAKLLPPR